MGCNFSHIEKGVISTSKEEEIIPNWEKSLNFYTLKDDDFLRAIDARQDDDGLIPINSLWDLFYLCDFPGHSFPVNTGPVSIFYKTIRKEGKIDAQKLMTLIILTSSFKDNTKAQLIFKVYRENKEFMKEKTLERLLIDLSNISINLIWMALGKQPGQLSKDILMRYEEKLEQGQLSFIYKLKHLIIDTEYLATEKGFLNRIGKYPKFLSPSGIRKFILKEIKEDSLLSPKKPYIRLMSIKTSDTLDEITENDRGSKRLNIDFSNRKISKNPSKSSNYVPDHDKLSSKVDEKYLKNSLMMKKIVEAYLGNLKNAVKLWKNMN